MKKIAFQGNSARCLIQRQRFAMKMLNILFSEKIIINCDETWLDSKDYRRYKWIEKGKPNTAGVKSIDPRISFFLALDTDGKV